MNTLNFKRLALIAIEIKSSETKYSGLIPSPHPVSDETKHCGSIPSPHPVHDETKSFGSTPSPHPLDATLKKN